MSDIDEISDHAFELVRRKQIAEARALLQSESETARRAGDRKGAGHLTSTLAIVCFMQGDVAGAESAYRQAVADDPTNYCHREHLARFLLQERDEPLASLRELDGASSLMPSTVPTARYNFTALRASILFAAGQSEEALAHFRAINDPAIIRRMDSRGLDIDIARKLCRARIALPEVRSYAELVLAQAQRSSDEDMKSAAASLLSQCEEAQRPPSNSP